MSMLHFLKMALPTMPPGLAYYLFNYLLGLVRETKLSGRAFEVYMPAVCLVLAQIVGALNGFSSHNVTRERCLFLFIDADDARLMTPPSGDGADSGTTAPIHSRRRGGRSRAPTLDVVTKKVFRRFIPAVSVDSTAGGSDSAGTSGAAAAARAAGEGSSANVRRHAVITPTALRLFQGIQVRLGKCGRK